MTSEVDGVTVAVVSDGRAGIEAPALGLAEALGARFARHHLAFSGLVDKAEAVLPYLTIRAFLPPAPKGLRLAIGAGRRAAPVLRAWRAEGVKTIFLGDPRIASRHFDLVIAPAHDRVQGANVVTMLGSAHRIRRAVLAELARVFEHQVCDLPRPRLAVLIGGRSKRHDLPAAAAGQMAERLVQLSQAGHGLMITLSRRTPDDAAAILRGQLAGRPGIRIYSGAGPNPYQAYLALADGLVVTADSVNMISEAVATGKPVWIQDMPGTPGKLKSFHDALITRGLARPFTGSAELWRPQTFDDMAEAVVATQRLWQAATLSSRP